MTFDTLVLPPDFTETLARLSGGERPSFMGMRVIESPLAYKTRRVPDRLQRSRTPPFRDYEMTYKEVREPVALMFNTQALGFLRPFPPLYKRDLCAFQDPRMGIVPILTAAAS
jgi:hypothetical protein